jgi:hypothetical protein
MYQIPMEKCDYVCFGILRDSYILVSKTFCVYEVLVIFARTVSRDKLSYRSWSIYVIHFFLFLNVIKSSKTKKKKITYTPVHSCLVLPSWNINKAILGWIKNANLLLYCILYCKTFLRKHVHILSTKCTGSVPCLNIKYYWFFFFPERIVVVICLQKIRRKIFR